MLKGALHVHSVYSDGDLTLGELRDRFLRAGCDFACVTDHADAFDQARVREYERECTTLSDERFRFVPGLEFGCVRRMHIVGYGVTALADSDEPQQVIDHIARAGGVSVIAHPASHAFEWIETFQTLPDGVETWNAKYDGRYAPRPATFALVRRLQLRRPDVRAFYGIDLHWRTQFAGLFTLVNAVDASHSAILSALARGAFVGLKDDLELPSSGELSEALLAHFGRIHGRSQRIRTLLKSMSRTISRAGATIPAPVKAQLRRLF
ncbi:MAG: PHP domain-containing protein [Gemmatimonadaceae bacterium]